MIASYPKILSSKETEAQDTVLGQFLTCDNVKTSRGTHPQAIAAPVRGMGTLRTSRNRWPNWQGYPGIVRQGFSLKVNQVPDP